MSISEQLLTAYADGELDDADRAAVEAALAADPVLAAQLERHRRLRQEIAGAYGEAMSEPVPHRLLAAVRGKQPSGAPVVDLAAARSRRRRSWLDFGAIAASVAAGLIVGQALHWGQPSELVASAGNGLVARGALDTALTQQLAADRSRGPIRIGVSFHAGDGSNCRTFQVERGPSLAGVACREPRAWSVRMVMTQPSEAVPGSDYRMAASPMPEPLAAAVDHMIRGAPMDAAAETAAKAKGWRN